MRGVILVLLITLSCPVCADGGFHIRWEDLFPMCALDADEGDIARCGCEFIVPNFHLGLIANMFTDMLVSFFVIGDLAEFATNARSDLLGTIGNIIGGVMDTVFEPSKIINGFISWVFGVITPFFVFLLIISFEFIKTYLIFAIPLMLWIHVLKEINWIDNVSPMWGVYLAVFAVVAMFLGSLWLLGSDMGLYKPLVVW